MEVILDGGIKKNCQNLYDSYGEICVHCGCCSSDPNVKYPARYELWSRMLKEDREKLKDPDFGEFERKNIRADIKYSYRRVRYYKKKLEELENA